MLTLESLSATQDLVAILADRGVKLGVVPNTPVAELMSATKIDYGSLNCLSEIDSAALALYRANDIKMVGAYVEEDPHTAYLEHAGQQLGLALASHVSQATTIVLPAIGELYAKLKESTDTEATCGVRSYKVEMVTGSNLLEVSEIANDIDKFEGVQQPRDLILNLDFKPLADEAIVALMKIGSQDYDAAIDLFVSQEGMVAIREVWEVVFQNEKRGFKTYDEFRADRSKGLVRNFVTFLIASKLLIDAKALPDVTGLSGLSSSKYPMILKSLQEVSGSALAINLNNKRAEEKSGKLIEKIENKVVYVHKAVYDRFMDEGGDVETLLGAAISGEKKIYLPDIVADVEKFKMAWEYHVTLARQNAGTTALIDSRRAIIDFIRGYVRVAEDEIIRSNAEKIIARAVEFVGTIYRSDLDRLEMLAMKAVCKIAYSHTDAIVILAGVSEAMSANPEITKESALEMSVLNYAAEWIADRIFIK